MDGGTINIEIMKGFSTKLMYLFRELPVVGPVSYLFTNFMMWCYLGLSFFVVLNVKNCSRKEFKPTVWNSVVTSLLIVLSVLSFSGVTEFLYFNF